MIKPRFTKKSRTVRYVIDTISIFDINMIPGRLISVLYSIRICIETTGVPGDLGHNGYDTIYRQNTFDISKRYDITININNIRNIHRQIQKIATTLPACDMYPSGDARRRCCNCDTTHRETNPNSERIFSWHLLFTPPPRLVVALGSLVFLDHQQRRIAACDVRPPLTTCTINKRTAVSTAVLSPAAWALTGCQLLPGHATKRQVIEEKAHHSAQFRTANKNNMAR